jgi:surface antigen Omp85-like protein
VLRVTGGARSPALAPDGRVVFVGYTAQGFDLFESRIAMHGDTGGASPHGGLDTAVATPLGRIAMRVDTDGATPSGRVAMRLDDKYRPWPTLLPHGWLPLIDRRDGRWRLGAVVTGYDVLGRHVIAADATWAVNDGDVGGGLAPRSRPDWSASYVYQRWQIAPFVSVRDRTSLFNAVTTEGSVVPVAQREQQVDAGIYRAFRRIRWTQTVTGMFHAERVSTAAPALEQDVDRSGLRTSWTLFTARQYGYSISPEDGIGLGVSGEFFLPAFGSDGRADAFTADSRAYISLPRQSVVALRLAGAASSGDPGLRREFRLGGSDGNAALGVFGSDAISLLRGFEDDVVSGTRVTVMNAELRVPVVWPQRGVGTWPVFLRSVHATLFTDIGNAWTDSVRWADRKTGVGAELSADVTAGFGLPLTWTMGVAWGHDGAGVLREGREVYVRLGRSF